MSQLLVDNMGSIAAIVGAAVLWLISRFFASKAALYERLFKLGVEVAYRIVDDVAAKSENKVDDKIALGLKYLHDWMESNGQTLKPVDEEKAKLLFQAMHGAEKTTGAPEVGKE